LRRLGVVVPVVHEDDAAEIERAAGLAVLRSMLAEELGRLGPGQREAVRLRVIEELPYVELARRLGVSEQTARARVSRGLRAMAAALDQATVQEERA
jgi:RNA polymerase sigma factor (sigma-70 family)